MFDETQKNAIRAEAQSILKRFSEKISRFNLEQPQATPASSGMRGNETIHIADSDFRELMFKNAPKKEGDFIIGETKRWQ